jgi:hypothetical protein
VTDGRSGSSAVTVPGQPSVKPQAGAVTDNRSRCRPSTWPYRSPYSCPYSPPYIEPLYSQWLLCRSAHLSTCGSRSDTPFFQHQSGRKGAGPPRRRRGASVARAWSGPAAPERLGAGPGPHTPLRHGLPATITGVAAGRAPARGLRAAQPGAYFADTQPRRTCESGAQRVGASRGRTRENPEPICLARHRARRPAGRRTSPARLGRRRTRRAAGRRRALGPVGTREQPEDFHEPPSVTLCSFRAVTGYRLQALRTPDLTAQGGTGRHPRPVTGNR